MPNVLIAGGGSGGHVAPAIAIAEALSDIGCTSILAHSNRRVDSMMASQTPFDCITLPAAPLSLTPVGFMSFCWGFKRTEQHVYHFIEEAHIDCVLSTGGYVAAPALRAAKKRTCPTVLLNLDNPPGKANRLAIRWADKVLTTVKCRLRHAHQISPPLRQCVIASSNRKSCFEEFGLDPHRMTLLVTGASQGATSINEFIPALAKQHFAYFHGWQVLHIAGVGHVDIVKKYWEKIDIPCLVVDFVQNMGLAWGVADLAITRGGANTIAELAFNAVPAVVLPYPYHRDDHQRINAKPLAAIGGIIIEKDHVHTQLNIAHAGDTILKLLKRHQQRLVMRQYLSAQLPTNGAITIAETCLASI